MDSKLKQEKNSISFSTLLLSVLSAFFGVQSSANRQRDFSSGKLFHFIIIGLILALVFILILLGLVKLAIGLAASS